MIFANFIRPDFCGDLTCDLFDSMWGLLYFHHVRPNLLIRLTETSTSFTSTFSMLQSDDFKTANMLHLNN